MMNDRELEEWRGLRMFAKGVEIATNKADGAVHHVEVTCSQWERSKWLSLIVDDMREDGGKLGVGSQSSVYKAEVFAPKTKEVRDDK